MKKTIVTLLLLCTGAVLGVQADKKKKTNTGTQPVQQTTKVTLKNQSDTLSYTSGMMVTEQLGNYLKGTFNVETAQYPAVAEGIQEVLQKSNDPTFNARNAGINVGQTLIKNVIPSIEKQLQEAGSTFNRQLFIDGFLAALLNDTTLYTPARATTFARDFLEKQIKAKNEAYKKQNEAWLAENKNKTGVVTLPSGLQYKVITAGNGATPKATDEVTVKYEGKLIDGTVFDSSYKRNPQTNDFRADQVIKGWTEALTLMHVGSKWELYIPQELAYGERETGPIKPYSTLIFTVELVNIKTTDEPKTDTAKPAAKPAPVKKKTVTRKRR